MTKGWRREPVRHALAAKGISSKPSTRPRTRLATQDPSTKIRRRLRPLILELMDSGKITGIEHGFILDNNLKVLTTSVPDLEKSVSLGGFRSEKEFLSFHTHPLADSKLDYMGDVGIKYTCPSRKDINVAKLRGWKYLGIGIPVRDGRGMIVGIYEVDKLGSPPALEEDEFRYFRSIRPQIEFVVEKKHD